MTVLTLIVVISLVSAFFCVLALYISLRSQANRALKLAIEEFYDASNSMLNTPSDLPNEVLSAIRSMSDLAFRKGSDIRLQKSFRNDRLQRGIKGRSAANSVLYQKVMELRPELRDLFFKVCAAWITIMSNRRVVVGAMLQFEIQALQVSSGSVTRRGVGEAEAMKVLPRMNMATNILDCAV